MSSGLASLFPGVDLCTLPAGTPPEGQTSNFTSPTTFLRDLTIIFTVIPTVSAIVFSFGRLWANFKRRTWGDYLVLLAVLVAVTQNVLILIFIKYNRHVWDVPLCWMNAQLMQVSYAYEELTIVGLFLAKTATLLLFHQLFQVSRQTRWAIRAGIIVNALLSGSSFIAFSYQSLPHVGETWDDLVVALMLEPEKTVFSVSWSVAQSSVGAALDIYIFILPLPTIARLQLPSRKRFQLMAVFFTAILGIVASIVSLAYRSTLFSATDSTWLMGVIMICNQVELVVAIIVSSMPGFSSFVRTNVAESKVVLSLRSLLGSMAPSGSRGTIQQSANFNSNQPRSGSNPRELGKKSGYYELNEPWRMDSPFIVNVEHQPGRLQPAHEDSGAISQSSLDVEQLSCSPSRESGRGFTFH